MPIEVLTPSRLSRGLAGACVQSALRVRLVSEWLDWLGEDPLRFKIRPTIGVALRVVLRNYRVRCTSVQS